MKKLISMIVAAMMLSISAHAATTYDVAGNSVSTDSSGYKTVLISKGEAAPTSSDDIVYINQADDGFSAATDFFLKAAPGDGKYTIRFGSGETAVPTKTFYIGTGIEGCDYEMENVGEEEAADGTYNIGYKATVTLSECKSLLVVSGDKVLGYAFPFTVSDGGAAEIGVQINGVSEADKAGLKVYVSERGIVTDTEVQQ